MYPIVFRPWSACFALCCTLFSSVSVGRPAGVPWGPLDPPPSKLPCSVTPAMRARSARTAPDANWARSRTQAEEEEEPWWVHVCTDPRPSRPPSSPSVTPPPFDPPRESFRQTCRILFWRVKSDDVTARDRVHWGSPPNCLCSSLPSCDSISALPISTERSRNDSHLIEWHGDCANGGEVEDVARREQTRKWSSS